MIRSPNDTTLHHRPARQATGALNVALVGCGLIGRKRLATLGESRLVGCADVVAQRAQQLASGFAGAEATTDWQSLVSREDVDVVLVAVLHRDLPVITQAAVAAGKHVLVEKPGGRHPDEIQAIIDLAAKTGSLVRVGFNHRYHPALLKAQDLVREGAIGDLMFIRARYGHGGRLGYDREWRADRDLSGGGELIDQGVHLIDLARLFLGDFSKIDGFAHTYYWDMPVDDNGFLTLRTPRNQVAFLHASCTEWKNLFSMEIYGRTGKLDISGLGGSYGIERLTYYRMLPEMGPPETTAWEYPRGDNSWKLEWTEFVQDIRLGRQPKPGLIDARAALEVVNTIYQLSANETESQS